jgi:hypothetical protein
MKNLAKRRNKGLVSLVLVILLLGSFIYIFERPVAVQAAPTTINVTSSSGGTGATTCTLRDAITAANKNTNTGGCVVGAGGAPFTINLQKDTVYTLSQIDNNLFGLGNNGLPVIATDITINGNGATIQRDSNNNTPNFRFFFVRNEGKLKLENLTLRNGSITGGKGNDGYGGGGGGGGGAGLGGAIFNRGTVTVTGVTFDSNKVAGGNGGKGSTGSSGKGGKGGNDTGGDGGNDGDEAGGGGGGNPSRNAGSGGFGGGGGGASNSRGSRAGNSNFGGGSGHGGGNGSGGGGGGGLGAGGAIFNSGFGTLNVTNSTFYKNTATGGGGEGGAGHGSGAGGAILNFTGTLNLQNVTLTANSAKEGGTKGNSWAGGIFNFAGKVNPSNTLIAANSADIGPDVFGLFASKGYNLIGNTNGSLGFVSSDLKNTNPGTLGALTNNGGPTPTIALPASSPAIDAGNPSASTCPATDQRGIARPVDGNKDGVARCDIGAFEYQNSKAENDSWPKARQLGFTTDANGLKTADAKQALTEQNGSLWYKFSAGQNSKVFIVLTGDPGVNLPVNYDLSFYRDLQKEYNALNGTPSLQQLTTQSLPESYLPESYLPESYLPESYLPESYLPESYLPESYLPESYLPESYLPESYLPESYLPESYLAEPYSGALKRGLIAVSARPGLSPERISRNTFSASGDFYVRVKGRDGASSPSGFKLQVAVMPGNCEGVSGVTGAVFTAPSSSYNTLFLTDFNRLTTNPAEQTALRDKINNFMTQQGINGTLVDFSSAGFERVASANSIADSKLACPYAKNLVAKEIKEVIKSYNASNPIEYVVLLGSDNVIPFVRYPDQAGLANESLYSPPVKADSASQAALGNGLMLGQDYYGAFNLLNTNEFSLPLPQVPVGRLVKTVPDIIKMLDAYTGEITPGTGLVTGYDFVSDVATNVAEDFRGNSLTVDSLISNTWTATDLKNNFINKKHDLVFLAGHFSSGGTQAADNSTRVTAAELAASTVDHRNSIVFSVGCHSGYDIPLGDALQNYTELPDWSQAFARKGMTAVIGTGFQYGDTELVGFSEKLYYRFSQELRTNTGNGVSVGQALINAKQQYLGTTSPMRGIHEKVVTVATLYGLPMMKVKLSGGSTATDSSKITGTTPVNGAPAVLSTADLTIDPQLQEVTNQLFLANTNVAKTARYYYSTAGGPVNGIVANPLEPVLPLDMHNVNVPNTVLRGVGFRGGTFTDLQNFFPLVVAPATEFGPTRPTFGTSTFYPNQPWTINYTEFLNPKPNSPNTNVRLAVTPAQYKSNSLTDPEGTFRKYDKMSFRLFYSSYTGPAAFVAAPTISGVTLDASGKVSAKVSGETSAGITEVWITYYYEGTNPGTWVSLNLTLNNTTGKWDGDLPTTNLGNLRFMVQAANGVGLVTLATNNGKYFSLTPPQNPTVNTTQTLQLTGFDANQTASYSSQVTLNATLFSVVNGNQTPLGGKTVTFGLGGIFRTAVTDATTGQASVSLKVNLPPGDYYASFAFDGDDTFLPSATSLPVKIAKEDTVLTLTSPVSTNYGLPAALTATLKDTGGTPLVNKLVLFTATSPNSPTPYYFSAFTNNQGQAVVTNLRLPVGNYNIQAFFNSTVAGVGQAADPLYNESVSGSVTLGITPATLTVKAKDATRVYGQPNPPFEVEVSGVVGGDDVSSLYSSIVSSTTATQLSMVGAYDIVPSGPTTFGNYTVAYINGKLAVTKADLTITADNKSKIYGTPNPPLTATYSGFVGTDNETTLGLSNILTTTANNTSPVGDYPITLLNPELTLANYNIIFNQGTLKVTKADLKITADNKSKVYGAPNPPLTATYSGLVGSDTPTSLGLSLTTTATQFSPTGDYPITLAAITLQNYNIIFTQGTLTITKANTSTSLVSSLNPSQINQAVTFTATVSAVAPGAGTPTGTVEFFDGATSLGSGTLGNGKASITVTNLATGSRLIKAVYAGDSNFNGSTSTILKQTVKYKICLLYDPTKPSNIGSTQPIKLQLCDETGKNLSSPNIKLKAIDVDGKPEKLKDSGKANPGMLFRYEAGLGGSGGYIFNLKLDDLYAGEHYLSFIINDDTSQVYKAKFYLKYYDHDD